MKIAVYHNLPSGGAKRTLYEQVKRLSAQDQVDVFSLSCANHDFCDLRPFARQYTIFSYQSLPLLRSPFGRLNQIIRWFDLYRLRRMGRQAAKAIDSGGYDVVLVHPCQYTNSPAVLRYLATPSVFYCQDSLRIVYDPPQNSNPAGKKYQRLLDKIDPLPKVYLRALAGEDRTNISCAERVLVNSNYSQATMQKFYHLEAYVCYQGVDTALFRPLNLVKQSDKHSDNQAIVISVGALRPNKGFDFIIESLALIPSRQRPEFQIACNYTDPQLQADLMNLAARLGVDLNIRGMLIGEELVSAYNQASLTVYAPWMEPFGLAPIESMACGTPVVGIAEAGVRETVLDGETGILVKRDPILFSEAIKSLLSDPERLNRYARQGRDTILKQWTWEAAIQQLKNHLFEISQGGCK